MTSRKQNNKKKRKKQHCSLRIPLDLNRAGLCQSLVEIQLSHLGSPLEQQIAREMLGITVSLARIVTVLSIWKGFSVLGRKQRKQSQLGHHKLSFIQEYLV